MTPTTRRPDAGFTLLEILVASALLGVAVMSATWALSGTARTKEVLTRQPVIASMLAREIHELAQTLPREPSGQVGVTAVGNVLALDSLHGASFSPPVCANGAVESGLSGWSQHVSLSVHPLSDLSTTTADSAVYGIGKDEAKLYRLRVEIRKDGAQIDTHDWWITP